MPRFVVNPPVFFGASLIILAFAIAGALAPKRLEAAFTLLQAEILSHFGWFYLLAVAIFLLGMLFLGFSRFGAVKLGPDDSTPDYPFASWIAMLFAAGMGIGLMFFAVAEPMTHFANPPEAASRSIAASRQAMAVTFFHWGIHAWAVYAVVGLSLAYFGYRYNLPLTIRSGLYPILKERIEGPFGHAVDIFAVCGTIFGIATSLGFGVLQINAGLNHLVGLPATVPVQLALVAVITAAATTSALTGIDRGIRRLSELNLILAIALMLFVLAIGPTTLLLRTLVQNIGLYLDSIVLRTFNIYAYQPRKWIDSWTLFYWAWWISWSPFVGMFIARISRGRTIREFVVAVLFVPAGFTFVWMTVFGNTAMYVDTTVANGALADAVIADVAVGLFRFFEYLPLSTLTSALAVMLVAVFFVTSADSGALVVDTIAAGGAERTSALQRLYWCAILGIVAAVLLLAGGLTALQTAAIASALPFAVVMLILLLCLVKGLRADLARGAAGTTAPAVRAAGLSWQQRLGLLLHAPDRDQVARFIAATVDPALRAVAAELQAQNRQAAVEHDPEHGGVRLVVVAEGVRNFVYGVKPASRRLPAFTAIDMAQDPVRHEARTYFCDGSRGYDIMGLQREQIIGDVLSQFARYLALVRSPHSQLYLSVPEGA